MSTIKHRTASLWAALSQFAGKQLKRDDLTDGSSTPIDLVVTGKVDRIPCNNVIAGQLLIGHPSSRASSSGVDQAELLAQFAQRLGPQQRQMFYELLTSHFATHQSLPPGDAAVVSECKHLLKNLRFRKTSNVAPSLRFEPNETA